MRRFNYNKQYASLVFCRDSAKYPDIVPPSLSETFAADPKPY